MKKLDYVNKTNNEECNTEKTSFQDLEKKNNTKLKREIFTNKIFTEKDI